MPISQKDLDNRFTYHSPQDSGVADIQSIYASIRAAAKEVAELVVSRCPDSRETSLSITHLEEAVFWANAALARQNTR